MHVTVKALQYHLIEFLLYFQMSVISVSYITTQVWYVGYYTSLRQSQE